MAFNIYLQEGTATIALSFTSLINLNFSDNSTITSEVVENGSFSMDSKQNSPYVLTLTAIKAPYKKNSAYKYNDLMQELSDLNEDLMAYKEGTALFKIYANKPIFTKYEYLSLEDYDFSQTTEMPSVLYCNLKFLQIRQTVISNLALPASQVANPTAASQVDYGNLGSGTTIKS